MRSLRLPATTILFGLGATLCAQNDIAISNANLSFRVEFNATPFVYVATTDFMRADPSGDPSGMLFKTAWAYRLDNDTREFIFNDGGGQATYINAGAVGIATWTNVDNRNQIAASAVYTAISTGTNSGVVVCRMSITNISAQPETLNLFHLADIDLCGPAGYPTNFITPGSVGRQVVTGSCTETAEHYAAGADRWEVGSYTGVPAGNVDLYTRLEDASTYDLRDDTATGGPFDVRGCYQWQNRVLLPNQTETYVIALGHNAAPCAFAFNQYGNSVRGNLGAPTLTTVGDAILGQVMTPTIGNAPPGTLGILSMSFFRGITTLGDLTLYVGAPRTNFVLPIGGSGTTNLPIPVPISTAYCGLQLSGQAFVFGDATSVSTTGLPVTQSRAALWTIGMY
ncbi:MAG TPA: hypothetical protein VK348_08060 [Planctomycetota bacterium]|nr:hypothetical protein [Planctomycetota bacterium]